jgi:hypothetical protein
MFMPSLRKILTPLLLVTIILITSCSSEPPSRFEDAQQQSQGQSVVVKESIPGSEFNKFFPNPPEGFQRVFTQEKDGFAEAKLKQNNQDVALLSISDILNNTKAVNKFRESSETLPGFPTIKMAKQGTGGTTILVGDRFQVKVLSINSQLTEDNRKVILTQFDLNGLAGLVKK